MVEEHIVLGLRKSLGESIGKHVGSENGDIGDGARDHQRAL
jgi:hypothetical protein